SQNSTIYEANIRQFSKEGTFKEFEKYLPELKKMGVKIVWLMPIHPIGELNRKGNLGSYYSVKDYTDVNPEFGTKEDFRHLVDRTHEFGMYLIIDWVANHAAWDNVWTKTHPEYFDKNPDGDYFAEVSDWTDVIDLNYDNPDLRRAMTDAMKYWVAEFDIDGFRCDVAAMVPTDFWNNVRKELETIKPVFMLAEAHETELHAQAFDMSYAWTFKDMMNEIAKGKKDVRDLDKMVKTEMETYHPDDYRMLFVTNHDENSWNGTTYERLGDAAEAFIAFTCIFRGMPLLYNGLEAGMNKALDFFDKDTIPWHDHPNREPYSKLFNLKLRNPALWNGISGGDFNRLTTSDDKNIFAFYREKGDSKVMAIFNFSAKPQSVKIKHPMLEGRYVNPLNDRELTLEQKAHFNLDKWDFLILEKR
ncbi:MAG: alpha-glucosidase C-terminal domain-containing protein, partial [Candidatus Marinimicrobia bacterium]|nr:alpha-glucosidase C-terminal domain-containing protein [Candidatus Neomarinimicrobiota bacterium]